MLRSARAEEDAPPADDDITAEDQRGAADAANAGNAADQEAERVALREIRPGEDADDAEGERTVLRVERDEAADTGPGAPAEAPPLQAHFGTLPDEQPAARHDTGDLKRPPARHDTGDLKRPAVRHTTGDLTRPAARHTTGELDRPAARHDTGDVGRPSTPPPPDPPEWDPAPTGEQLPADAVPGPGSPAANGQIDSRRIDEEFAAHFDALDTPRGPAAPRIDPPPQPRTPDTRGDTAEDLAALFNAPSPWDDPQSSEPTPPAPPAGPAEGMQESPPPPDTPRTPGTRGDTAEDLAALFNAPSPWDEAEQADDDSDTGEDLAAIFRMPRSWEPDANQDTSPPEVPAEPRAEDAGTTPPPDKPEQGEELVALLDMPPSWDQETQPYRPLDDMSEEPVARYGVYTETSVGADVEPPPAPPTRDDTAPPPTTTERKKAVYSPSEWPWVSKSGDGGFWAPPKDGHTGVTAAAMTTATGERAVVSGELPAGAGVATQLPAGGTRSRSAQPPRRPAGEDGLDRESMSRFRRSFEDLGAWTAVAQVALLAVGMLCIIQVFVLIVVSNYLSDAAGSGGAATLGSLAAYTKVHNIMLPALLGFTAVALTLGVWQALANRDNARPPGLLGRPLGIPISLWRVFVGAVVLLLITVLPPPPATVTDAQRVTQWFMVACTLLGAACFAAPRGIEAAPDGEDGEAGAKQDAAPRASARPAA